MAVIISEAHVHWGYAFDGFLPSSTLFKSGGLYTCELYGLAHVVSINLPAFFIAIGILGATVMPHSLFLGSALATQDRLTTKLQVPLSEIQSTASYDSAQTIVPQRSRLRAIVASIVAFLRSRFQTSQPEKSFGEHLTHAERENNSFEFINAHLYHGIIDMVISLLGLAVVINSL